MRETIRVLYQHRSEPEARHLERGPVFRWSSRYRPTDEETSAIAALRD